MKDRIRQIMEAQHMTQQVFANYIGTTPATLSGIFNDRTRPTINIIESIKKKFPDISLEWLMFGTGSMYQAQPASAASSPSVADSSVAANAATAGGQPSLFAQDQVLDFDNTPLPQRQNGVQTAAPFMGVKATHPEMVRSEIKFVDKPQRRVTEIRVYYDDQTWESFVPSKK